MESFRTLPVYRHSNRIHLEKGVISSVSVAHATEAVGHRLLFDQTSLAQLLDLGNASKAGRKPFQSPLGRRLRHSCSQRIWALTLRLTKSAERQVRLRCVRSNSRSADCCRQGHRRPL